MRLLLVAPPGAGKGTQAERICEHFGIEHIASGDLLRHEVTAGTPIGRTAKRYLERGDLVPDDLVLEMILVKVTAAAAAGGYVLDGFPRNVRQAEAAYASARDVGGVPLEAVVHLDVSRPELLRRILARARVEGRSDDNQATIDHRLAIFDEETEPLLGYYKERGLLVSVDGEQAVDVVTETILSELAARRP
jgi:adenylate kinase